MFAQKGYQGTNVSDIANELNIRQGIIYWYFKTKRNLFKTAFMEEFKAIKLAVANVLSDSFLIPGRKLQKLILEMLKVYYEKKEGCILILQLLSNKKMQHLLIIDIFNVNNEQYDLS